MLLDIKGIDKYVLLQELCKHAINKTYEILELCEYAEVRQVTFDPSQAREYIKAGNLHIRCYGGRVINADISGDQLDIDAYDEANGKGKAQEAIHAIRSTTISKY